MAIMQTTIPLALLTTLVLAPLHAGDWAQSGSVVPDPDSVAAAQSLFGAPDLRFGGNATASDLPGATVASASWIHQFDSDFDSLGGEVGIDDFSLWTVVAPLNFGSKHLITLLGYRSTQFDTSVPNMLTEDTLHSIRMPVVFLNDVSERWLWGGMIMPSFSGDLSSGDNFSIAAAVGAGYAPNPDLRIFGGAYYSHGFDEDFVIPGLMCIWRPDPKWEAYLLGPNVGVNYSVNETWILSLFGQYDSPTWHVEADASGPDRDIRLSSLRLGLKAECRLNKLCWASIAGGWSFARELEIEDLHSNALQEDDIDSGPFVQVGLNLRY
jgi:hypothetical protein